MNHWFLPHTPDVLGMLRAQLDVTLQGLDAFVEWAGGDEAAGTRVRELEHSADERKREVYKALRDSFMTPLEPEDLFVLSRGIDTLINQAKDLVREAEVMATPPDRHVAEMAALLAESVHQIGAAIAQLEPHGPDPTAVVDAAIKAQRKVEHAYRAAMGELVGLDVVRVIIARRELDRRCSRLGESAVDVAERILYAVVKET